MSTLFQVFVSVISATVLFISGYFAQSETSGYILVGCVAVVLFFLYLLLAPRFGQAYKITMFLFLLAGVFAFTYAAAFFREINTFGFEPQEIAMSAIEEHYTQVPLYVNLTGILRNDLTLHWSIKSYTPDASGASTYHEGYVHKCLTPFTGKGWNPEIPVHIVTDVCRPSWKKQSFELKTIQGYLVPIDTKLPLKAYTYVYPQIPVNPLPTVATAPMRFQLDNKTLLLMGKRRPENLVILVILFTGVWFIALLTTLLIKAKSSEGNSN